MDARLQALVKDAAADAGLLPRAIQELFRVGERGEAVRLLRGGLAMGQADLLGPVLDELNPPSLEGLSVQTHACGAGLLGGVAWHPNGVYVQDEDSERLLDWRFEGGAQVVVELEAQEPRTRTHGKAPLALSNDGRRLAFTAYRDGHGHHWCLLDVASGTIVRSQPGPGCFQLIWSGEVVIGVDHGGKEAWLWSPASPDAGPQRIAKATSVAVAEGTYLTRKRRTLTFHTSDFEAEASVEHPAPKLPGGWDGLTPAWGGRVVCCDQQSRRLFLLGHHGILGECPLPNPGGKLVAVRPSPSGWVVAMRTQWKRWVILVDLRRGERRRIQLKREAGFPRELVWSPSGKALAVPSQKALQFIVPG